MKSGLSFPDAPGCFSAADEMDDLFANASEALALWTEAMVAERQAIPAPRDLSELKRDPDWAESFEGAELVIGVARTILASDISGVDRAGGACWI